MEYQKIANLIDDNTLNQPSKFRTRNWIEINDESRGVYNVNSQIKFKTAMLKSSLCDFCIGFINFMFNGKSLTDYTNLFSPNDFNENDDIILKYFGL